MCVCKLRERASRTSNGCVCVGCCFARALVARDGILFARSRDARNDDEDGYYCRCGAVFKTCVGSSYKYTYPAACAVAIANDQAHIYSSSAHKTPSANIHIYVAMRKWLSRARTQSNYCCNVWTWWSRWLGYIYREKSMRASSINGNLFNKQTAFIYKHEKRSRSRCSVSPLCRIINTKIMLRAGLGDCNFASVNQMKKNLFVCLPLLRRKGERCNCARDADALMQCSHTLHMI